MSDTLRDAFADIALALVCWAFGFAAGWLHGARGRR